MQKDYYYNIPPKTPAPDHGFSYQRPGNAEPQLGAPHNPSPTTHSPNSPD